MVAVPRGRGQAIFVIDTSRMEAIPMVRRSLTISGLIFILGSASSVPADSAPADQNEDRAIATAKNALQRQSDYVKKLGNVRCEFKSEYRSKTSIHSAEGEAVWVGEKLRIHYKQSRKTLDGIDQTEGRYLQLPTKTVHLDTKKNTAFRDYARKGNLQRQFLIRPEKSWFTYDFQFPYRDILTANESFQFGDRVMKAESNSGNTEIVIDNPSSPGEIRFVFGSKVGGLISEVHHTNERGVRYRSLITWAKNENQLYPTLIEHFRRPKGKKLLRVFRLEFTEFSVIDPNDVEQDFFTEEGVGINDTVRYTTFAPGRRPIVRPAKKAVLNEESEDQEP